jgi:hypothetical protein
MKEITRDCPQITLIYTDNYKAEKYYLLYAE